MPTEQEKFTMKENGDLKMKIWQLRDKVIDLQHDVKLRDHQIKILERQKKDAEAQLQKILDLVGSGRV